MPASPSPERPRGSARQKKDATPLKPKAGPDKQAPMKGADFGKAIGINKPANVRDKIRKWQAEVQLDDAGAENAVESVSDGDQKPAAVSAPAPAPAPAPASLPAVSSPKLPTTPKTKPLEEKPDLRPSHVPTKSIDSAPVTPKSAKKAPVRNELDEDVQIATAPKKRVVSDSHWRNKKSPPKDATTRPSPKPLPTAWVRPKPRPVDTSESKPTTPPPKREMIIFTSKSTGQKQRSPRQRRPSQPASSGNEEGPTSSAAGSAEEPKSTEDPSSIAEPKSEEPVKQSSPPPPSSRPSSADKTELVRVRRRRRAKTTSPRGSFSNEDITPVKIRPARRSETSLSEDPANVITVEYARSRASSRDDELRERRRRRRRRPHSDVSADTTLKELVAIEGRRSRRKSPRKDEDHEGTAKPIENPISKSPSKVFGSRLEAWLQTTTDPFVDTDSHRRRKSKESISTLELSGAPEKSEVTASTDTKDTPAEEATVRTSSSKRKKRRPSPTLKVDTQDVDDKPSSTVSTDPVDPPAAEKELRITPSPTLKRRGAKRAQSSPTKERSMSSPLRLSTTNDDDGASSAPSSSVDSTTLDADKISLKPLPENLVLRRAFPSTGKRLSTIASVETFATKNQPIPPSDAVGSDKIDTATRLSKVTEDVPASEVGSQLNAETSTVLETSTIVSRRSTKRRLASHADLISVLSMPKTGSRSIVSARSIRTNRSRLATATIVDIMSELASDELKYMRELRTLVDGVIPVLLSCVLSKTDSALAASLFSRSSSTDPSNVTKPIVDMGVALERLKTLHRRVPKDNADAFLSWSQSAQRVYSDYINAWRLGFQDVVISLASADDDPFTPARVVDGPDDGAPWDEGLPRNAEGYVVNSDGERVDVAYMLKRPLVRLKYLAKTLKGINHVKPSTQAEKMSICFQELVAAARKRSNDEHARLEDEAAANIDPTRARDPRSLAPLAGVRIDPSRCVRARDHFDMHLYHSSGQELNCRVEILLRDDPPGAGTSGDVLLCEVDPTGRWLLLPPIQQNQISARNGDLKGEIIVMIRGYNADRSEWSEVMSLIIDEEQAGFEWVQMLGLNPIPPQLSEVKRDPAPTKLSRPSSSHASSSLVSAATGSTPPHKSRTPSPHEIEIPIGEQALATSKRWSYDTPERRAKSRTVSPITPPSGDGSRVENTWDDLPISPPSPIEPLRINATRKSSPPSTSRVEDSSHERTPRNLDDAMQISGSSSPSLRRTKAKRLSKSVSGSPLAPRPSRQIVLDDPVEEDIPIPRKSSKRLRASKPPPSAPSSVSQSSKGFSVWMPTSEAEYSDESEGSDSDRSVDDSHAPPPRPVAHRRASSVPTMDLPTIPKIRKTSQPSTPIDEPALDAPEVPEPPVSAPPKMVQDSSEPAQDEASLEDDDSPPPVPPHRSPSPATPVTLKGSKTPTLTPTLAGFKVKRRSSSPLKHEYEPSTCTETSSESEEEVSDDDPSLTSESSEDELEDDVPTPLMPLGQIKSSPKVSPPGSIYTLPNGTITPSQSASNTPYRAVPQDSTQASKAIASIFSWSDAGRWDSLHPEECSVVVTPGKIEVFEITAVHSKPLMTDGDEIIQPEGKSPLVALELTPLVPLRKSTAIDISIRSPPTAESCIKSGNNIMLRSRNPTECAQLYAMINQSRINNPTYIALQNARGPYGQSTWAEAMDRQNAARSNTDGSNGWFGGTLGRRSSYRKSSTRAASISAATESSVGTMNTALRSALGRFSFAKNSRLNARSSTLGSQSMNSFDSGSNRSGSGTSTPTNLEGGRAPGAPAGITNTKCRLYERESLTKWRDMGSARLTIMLPDPLRPKTAMREGKGSPGARDPSQEKRIIVVGKSKGETLLDVTLSESCFERVARSGIAVSVWEDIVGANGVLGQAPDTGGVSGARARTFMIQMKSERECAYSFSLLGKLRY
ncbi:hypothetical protein BS50DRAFT_628212 [Corynespora cassiicola Philippines]|uniref:DH domain-containing protein n=1 Tax=Corynespora cassiicola Philippines TaxID=1448308 RepID=A0A2T2PBB6_CORCC|nr:hypothetical protein BS50DRAFT_628212 [Corynespora cassiicola Philippines]